MTSRKPDRDSRRIDEDDDYRDPDINPRVLGRRSANTLLNRLVPSMMRSASFWMTAGLIVGVYLIAFLFVKDMVILPARVAPDSAGNPSPQSFVQQVLSGFAGDYEERVVETKPDGTVIVEQRYTVPTKFLDPRHVSPLENDKDKEKDKKTEQPREESKAEVPALLKAPSARPVPVPAGSTSVP
ncbi:MAG: hypothetical protein ACAI35_07705 [Candidatus Methylacidiphilales bacterium]|nr:hypothetical protein [Candidatus Methylacidiphilales bacterium]